MASSSNGEVTMKSSKDILSSVPLGICALGQMMLTASTAVNKSINNPPIGGFKHITDPDCLPTTLMQIGYCGYEAFLSGNLGMSVINCYSNDIETFCMEAERIIRKATPENEAFIDDIVRSKLRCMERPIKISKNESEKVVKALKNLLDLVEETSQACSNSKTVQERLLEENQKKEKELQEKKKAAEKEKLRKVKEREEYEEQLKNNREEFYSAHIAFSIAVPRGWALVRAEALNTIRDIFRIKYENKLRLMFDRLKKVREVKLEAEEKFQQVKEEIEALEVEIMDVKIQLIQLDMKKVSYDGALKIPQEVVELITQLLTHWMKLQEFFQSLSNAIQRHLSKKLDHLTSSQFDRSLMLEDILTLLKSTNRQSYQIGCFCDFYAKISSLHIMPAIKCVNRCSFVDPERIEQVSKELTAVAKKTHESIVNAIEKEDELDLIFNDKEEKIRIYELLTITDGN